MLDCIERIRAQDLSLGKETDLYSPLFPLKNLESTAPWYAKRFLVNYVRWLDDVPNFPKHSRLHKLDKAQEGQINLDARLLVSRTPAKKQDLADLPLY